MTTKHPDLKLRYIQTKTQWGCRQMIDKNSLICTSDNEFLVSVGARLMTLEHIPNSTKKTSLIETYSPDILYLYMMSLSLDNKYLAVLAKYKDDDSNTVNMLIYSMEKKLQDVNSRRPRPIKYVNTSFIDDKFEFTCIAFSHESMYIACGTNVPSKGVLIYDRLKELVVQTVCTDSAPRQVSFSPIDSSKLCTVGDGGLFKFWRFSMKSVHAAPVVGLRTGNFSFTCHTWVTPADGGLVIAGTSNGLMCVVQGCQQKVPLISAFGMSMLDIDSVETILVRGDVCIAASSANTIAVFEMKRSMVSKGVNVLSTNLGLIAKYKFTNVENIHGMQFNLRESINYYGIVCTTTSGVFAYDIVSENEKGVVHAKTNELGETDWTEVSNEKYVYSFHKSAIHSLSLATQSNTFITGSFDDSSVRFWDYNRPSTFHSAELIESFTDKQDENPFHVDMHPSGLFAMCACEFEVKEYAITDSQLELTRRISVKQPFTGPTGIPYLVTQPVSLVRYSHGGQYLAVVTGKLAQIFHLYTKDFNSASTTAGTCARIMILCDHISPITDLSFLRDDSGLVTTSSDGSVYSWVVGAATRDQEYVCKGIAATKLAVSTHKEKSCSIVACFESQAEEVLPLAANVVRLRRQSSIAVRKLSRNTTGLMSLLGHMNSESPMANFLSENSSHTPLTQPLNQKNTNPGARKKCFLAIWTQQISSSPKIIHVESPIRAIALGETDGSDKFEICVLGLEDGRIIVSMLPLPFRVVDPNALIPATPVTATVTGTLNISRGGLHHTGSSKKPRRALNHVNSMAILQENAADVVSKVSSADYSSQSSVYSDGGSQQSLSMNMDAIHEDNHTHHSATSHSTRNSQSPHSPTHSHTLSHTHSALTHTSSVLGGHGLLASSDSTIDLLDEASCKTFRLHVGGVTLVAISANGMFIFTAGQDGCVFMLATSKRALEYTEIPQSLDTIENRFLIADKTKLVSLKLRLGEVESKMDQIKKDNDLFISKIIESKDRKEAELRHKMETEVAKRDEAIFLGRKEYLQLKNNMRSEIAQIQKEAQDTVSALELQYEKKLSQEALYLGKMKQAYDEYVVHNKLDLTDLQRKTDLRISSIEAEKQAALREAEKQKATVLQYFDYVKIRNNEVMSSMEESQVEERHKLKEELRVATKQLQDAQTNKLSETVQFDLAIKKLEAAVDNKEVEMLRLKSNLEWSNERIMQLELSLQQATLTMGSREEVTLRWEQKTGELQQKIVELEKIRKALTTQLHSLREELGPKEEKLIKVSERLQEMDREYELSLHALSEKDKDLSHKSNNVGLLQKQVRELRYNANRKDAALRRAATLFDEYRFALQQAYYVSEKRTLNPAGGEADGKSSKVKLPKSGGALKAEVEVVEIIAQNEGMKMAMKRLNDILTPYLTEGTIDAEMLEEAEAVKIEQDRHMSLLHSNVTGLRANLDVTNKVAAAKVHNHLTDNQNLLREVNSLRSEVRSISLDNQRLQAQLDFFQHRKADRQHAHHSDQAQQLLQQLQLQQQQIQQLQQQRNQSPSHHSDQPQDESPGRDRFDSLNSALERSLLSASLHDVEPRPNPHHQTQPLPYKLKSNFAPKESTLSMQRNQSAPALSQDVDTSPARSILNLNSTELNQKLSYLSAQTYGTPAPGSTMTAAESKIAALIEMNVQEINAIKANEEAVRALPSKDRKLSNTDSASRPKKIKNVTTSRTQQSSIPGNASGLLDSRSLVSEVNMSLVSEGSSTTVGAALSKGSKTLGSAFIHLPPVHSKLQQQSR